MIDISKFTGKNLELFATPAFNQAPANQVIKCRSRNLQCSLKSYTQQIVESKKPQPPCENISKKIAPKNRIIRGVTTRDGDQKRPEEFCDRYETIELLSQQ